MTDWLLIILNPEKIGIPQTDSHLFHIFAAVTWDQIWFARIKALHEDLVPNALVISCTINGIVKKHHSAWTSKLILQPAVWRKPYLPYYKINYDIAIRNFFFDSIYGLQGFNMQNYTRLYNYQPFMYGSLR
jgi:hypothetical protein